MSASETSVMPTAATVRGSDIGPLRPGDRGRGHPPGQRPDGRHPVRVQVEDRRDDGRRHDADQDGRDDLGESGQHQQDGQDPEPDRQRRPDGAVEPEHEGLELGTEALGVGREPEELGQLPDDDDEGETVHVADLHLAREQIGDEPELPDPQSDFDDSNDDREHPGQRDRSMDVSARRQQWQEGGEDQGRDRRVRTEDQDPRRAEDRIADEASDGRVEAGHGREPGQLRVGQSLRHQDGGEHDARDDVGPRPSPVVGPNGPETRYPPGYPRRTFVHVPPFPS